MEDSGSVEVIARFMTDTLGSKRTILAVVLAGAIVTYGGVSHVKRPASEGDIPAWREGYA